MIPVMIVEDEYLIRIGLKTGIPWNKVGYAVVAEADSAECALEQYILKRPRLVIIDIHLPRQNGLELMRQLRSKDPTIRFIIISAYSEFSIAQEAIEIGVDGYFIKGDLDIDKITLLLTQLRDKYFLHDSSCQVDTYYVGDGIQNLEEALEKWRASQFLIDSRAHQEQVFLSVFSFHEVNGDYLEEIIRDYFLKQGISIYMLREPLRMWCFMSTSAFELTSTLLPLTQIFSSYFSSKIRVGVSSNYFDHEELERTIYEALLALRQSSTEHTLLSCYHDGSSPAGTIQAMLKKYSNLCEVARYEDAATYLGEINSSICFVGELLGIIYGIIGILSTYGKTPITFNSYPNRFDLNNLFTQLKESTLQLRQGREKSINLYVSKAMDFIEQNYNKPLKISYIAQQLYVSPNYLGRLFQAETGIRLTDYINQVKIEHAKKLLLKPENSVLHVAFQVGIPDQRYFSTLFKKFSGLTPTEYEKMNR